MSNYRVRQVLALPKMPENQFRLLLALATYLNDDSRSVRIGFNTLVSDAGNVRNTVRTARRELEARGALVSQGGGRGPRDVPLWTVLCLPDKGVSDVDPLIDAPMGGNDVDPLAPVVDPAKGVNRDDLRGSTCPEKGGQPKTPDLHESDAVLNRSAKSQCYLSPRARDAVLAAVPDATETEILTFIDEIGETRAPGNIGAYVASFPARQIVEAFARMRQGLSALRLTRQEEQAAGFAKASAWAETVTNTETSAAALLLTVVDPGVNADEAAEALEVLRQRGARQPVAMLQAELDDGNGYKLLGEARHRLDHQADAQWDAGTLAAPPAADVPDNGTPAQALEEPQTLSWKQVECPVCKAAAASFCTNPATGGHAATHKERHRAAREGHAEAVTP